MTDAVPIYAQSKSQQFFRYGTQMTAENGWDQNKTIAFYAYSAPQEGTIPFYRHRSGDRFEIDTIEGAHDGWTGGEDPFYAYPSTQPRTGTIPIYVHPNSNGQRFQYNTQIPGGAGWGTGQLAFFALPTLEGYRVGDKAADIVGQDQSGKTVQLSKYSPNKDWILVDICAQWCGPCNFAAEKTRGFIDNVNVTKGTKLKLTPFTVLVDDRSYRASSQVTAQQWATKYNFDPKEAVVHCGGDPKSDLRWLVNKYTLANNIPEAAYPTYVLIDSDGVIRHFQQGFDLDQLQLDLSALAGVALTGGPWIGLT
ncbi:redoxin domain-containing protein [Rhizobium sp. CB3171]|uniref:TlpA family protein disulfide reductase n=1 Tax=unclassified Rhizobium TaxID=2613769 RepID=UPI00131A4B8E|nr:MULTISPECIES: redoxin domain-containing protein [Rhizobium]MDK4737656.1 redoxin domain-containing protein [Rhizobium sp. CNPSo 3464]UWU22791.1 peroxiredoxin family protein [Rhizobium tropici]WFU03582.1 redoxin domain-containing protein [Rhizobium sp. CB3171]